MEKLQLEKVIWLSEGHIMEAACESWESGVGSDTHRRTRTLDALPCSRCLLPVSEHHHHLPPLLPFPDSRALKKIVKLCKLGFCKYEAAYQDPHNFLRTPQQISQSIFTKHHHLSQVPSLFLPHYLGNEPFFVIFWTDTGQLFPKISILHLSTHFCLLLRKSSACLESRF